MDEVSLHLLEEFEPAFGEKEVGACSQMAIFAVTQAPNPLALSDIEC
jgi:hypothetical protein